MDKMALTKGIIKRIRESETIFSALLVGAVALLAYAPLIDQLGFYKEDWYVIWTGLTQGPKALIPLYVVDRPLEGYLYALLYSVLGSSPLPWQLYALFLRLLGIFTFFWLLRMLWPQRKLETTIATLLFAIYPGFVQQPQAVSFQVHLTGLTLGIISITLNVSAQRSRNLASRVIQTLLAMAAGLIYPLTMEYYIGMEGARVLILWIALQQREPLHFKQSLFRMIKRWAPYLLITGIFLFWRLFIFAGSRPTTDLDHLVGIYRGNYFYMLARFIIEFFRDLIETTILAWGVPFYNYLYQGSYQDTLFGLMIAFVGMALFLGYYYFINKGWNSKDNEGDRQRFSKTLIWVGLLAAIFTVLPVIAANREIKFMDREDRFSLPTSFGVAFFITGLVFYALRSKWRV